MKAKETMGFGRTVTEAAKDDSRTADLDSLPQPVLNVLFGDWQQQVNVVVLVATGFHSDGFKVLYTHLDLVLHAHT